MDKIAWKRFSIDLLFVAGALIGIAVLVAPSGLPTPQAPPPPAVLPAPPPVRVVQNPRPVVVPERQPQHPANGGMVRPMRPVPPAPAAGAQAVRPQTN